MNMRFGPRHGFAIGVCVLLALAVGGQPVRAGSADAVDQAGLLARSGKVAEATTQLEALLKDKATAVAAGYELGLIHYENNDTGKALPYFKNALAAQFPDVKSPRDQKALQALLNDKAAAAAVRYELGLVYQSQGKTDQAAALFRDALATVAAKGSTYVGIKKCKKCHFKQYKSWKKTKMAKVLEILKPGVSADAKTKAKLDPQKDYTKDPTCLACHTTGYGQPGGYIIPTTPADEKQAKANAGVTCEACHGPGSRFAKIHDDVMKNNRTYKFEEFYAVGQQQPDARSCTSCHNRRNPTVGSEYHFDYEKTKDQGVHDHIKLKHRAK